MRERIEGGSLHLPEPTRLLCSDVTILYQFVSDEAFPLKTHMMKPYPRSRAPLTQEKLVFNYKISRARRMVGESSSFFTYNGILIARICRIGISLAFCQKHNILVPSFGSWTKARTGPSHFKYIHGLQLIGPYCYND